MKINSDRLASALQSRLSPLYLVSGDDPLLVNESTDQIRQAARQQGFSEREVFHAESGTFDWELFLQSANSMSLFSEKKILEIRSNKKNLSHELFLSYWQRPNPDILVLVITEKLDKQTLATKWCGTLEQAGILLQIWPLDEEKMLGWLAQRAKQQGLQIARDALITLRDCTEGNLLAAVQELEKLQLLYGNATINAEQMQEVVKDSARYDAFQLMDAALAGNASDVSHILRSLYAEGEMPIAILNVLLRDLRVLIHASEAIMQGQPAQGALYKQGVWEKRQPLFQQILKRHSTKALYNLLQRAQRIDLSVKGMDSLNPADALENLLLAIAGKKIAA